MTNSLEEIRKNLQQKEQAQNNPQSNSNGFYPFWNTPEESTVVLRFLPDADKDNVYFWRERQIIRIPFATVEGRPDLTDVVVEVPCMKMYGKDEVCPILTETRPWWKTEKEDLARRYWPKKTYIYQGFVRSSGFSEDNPPENPIRRFVISKQIHKLIEASLMDPDMENLPTHFDNGTDFRVVKKKGSPYADYATSNFSRKESALTLEEREAVENFGLFDLKTFLPRRPSDEEQKVIYDMFVESLKDGDSVYRTEWASFFKPKGINLANVAGQGTPVPSTPSNESVSSSAPSEPVQEQVQEKVEDKVEKKSEPVSQDTDDILAKLRQQMGQS